MSGEIYGWAHEKKKRIVAEKKIRELEMRIAELEAENKKLKGEATNDQQ